MIAIMTAGLVTPPALNPLLFNRELGLSKGGKLNFMRYLQTGH